VGHCGTRTGCKDGVDTVPDLKLAHTTAATTVDRCEHRAQTTTTTTTASTAAAAAASGCTC